MRFSVLILSLLLAAACAPRPGPAVMTAPAAPKPAPSSAPLPPATAASTLIEASCVRLGSIPMAMCPCWSRHVAIDIDAGTAAAYGIQNVGKRADAMTALKPEQMKAFLAAGEKAEATCAGRH